MLGRTDARQHEQLRRLERAGAEDDLALDLDGGARALVLVFDADGALVGVEQQPMRARAGQDVEVRLRAARP